MTSEISNDNFVVVPWQSISEDTLQALLEEFISREGTDYGAQELSLADKVQRAKKALENNHALIIVDLALETTQIVDTKVYQKMIQG